MVAMGNVPGGRMIEVLIELSVVIGAMDLSNDDGHEQWARGKQGASKGAFEFCDWRSGFELWI